MSGIISYETMIRNRSNYLEEFITKNFDYDDTIHFYKTISIKILWFLFRISCVHINNSIKFNCGLSSYTATEFYRDTKRILEKLKYNKRINSKYCLIPKNKILFKLYIHYVPQKFKKQL